MKSENDFIKTAGSALPPSPEAVGAQAPSPALSSSNREEAERLLSLAIAKADEAWCLVCKYEAAAEAGWAEAEKAMVVAGELDGEAERLYERAMDLLAGFDG